MSLANCYQSIAGKLIGVIRNGLIPEQIIDVSASQDQQGVYLNYDVAENRALIEQMNWSRRAPIAVLDEIHKMADWKQWLKGVFDGRQNQQKILVTGSARMDTFKQAGESLAGRFFSWRLHPISVREWCEHSGASAEVAMQHILQRGGYPEPCLATEADDAARWRKQYFEGLVRNDVLEFSRLHELTVMRLFIDLLRQRVGSPLSLLSISRDLAVSPVTLKRYLDILEALYIVFIVRPWHHNIARATLQAPKVYFFDNGLVQGDDGVKFENLVACHLLKHVHWHQDAKGQDVDLHYIRTKDGAEVDFCLSNSEDGNPTLTHLIECKISDTKPHAALTRFAGQWTHASAVQLVRDLPNIIDFKQISIEPAAQWLRKLSA